MPKKTAKKTAKKAPSKTTKKTAKKTSKKTAKKIAKKAPSKTTKKIAKKSPAKKTAKKTVKKAPAKKSPAKKAPAKKVPAKKAAPKKDNDTLTKITKKEMHDTFFQWKLDGYMVDALEPKIDTRQGPRAFIDYQGKIDILKGIEADIVTVNADGFEQEINAIKGKLKDPVYAEAVHKAYHDLRRRMKEKMFISMVHEGFKVITKDEAPLPAKKVPAKKAKAAEEALPELEGGSCYLMEEDKPDRSYRIYENMIAKGLKGVCVTREFPDKLKKKYNMGDSVIFWLSNTDGKNTFKPVELGKLYYNLEEFIKTNENTIIMLSGLEYLITQNNYSSVLKLIQLLNEQVAIYDSRLIIPISPSTLDEKDLKLIERELTVLK